jgi:hypothetical protein
MGGVHGKKKSKKSTHFVPQTESIRLVEESNVHFQNISNIKTIIYTLHALEMKFENTIPKEILSQILLKMVFRIPQSIPSSKSYSGNGTIKIVLLGDGGGIILLLLLLLFSLPITENSWKIGIIISINSKYFCY